MANKKKKYKVTQRSATKATSELKTAFRKFNWKLALTVIGLTVLLTSVYQVCMHFQIKAVVWIYYAALIILAVVYIIANRGISRTPPPREQLPSDWSDEKKDAFIADLTVRKKKARVFLIFIIPLLFNFMFEVIYLFYLEPLLSSMETSFFESTI